MDTHKLRVVFGEAAVLKSQANLAFFKGLSVPAFLRDWILRRKADADGSITNPGALGEYIRRIIPEREDNLAIKGEARDNGQSRKFLADVSFDIDTRTNKNTFAIPALGFDHSETFIEDYVWNSIHSEVERTAGGWGLVRLGYLAPDESRPKGQRQGMITLLEYKPFCPYSTELSAFCEARRAFSVEEWMDVLLGAIDYNPDGYVDWLQKHTMLTRLLPFVEPRLNLVELAPKGTGKSYLFGRVGKYGWLVSGGALSRAKMFHDVAKRQDGLVATHDFVALDEIQSITFTPDPCEMQGALKAYMEAGEATFGNQRVCGTAGIILLGNIQIDRMRDDANMFAELPWIFQESALLDRFHGFIRGINIPRMNEQLKSNDWALNTEYFSEILHLLREEPCYRGVVEALIKYPRNADTRDTEAVLRIATAYLKLLFPHVRHPEEANLQEFERYCLAPAVEMRAVIRRQLQILDPKEYEFKTMATYTLRDH